MNLQTAALFGAISGFTIFLGLPVAKLRGVSKGLQGFLNALATGVIIFLLWDILAHAGEPVEEALKNAGKEGYGAFAWLGAIFAIGLGVGLLAIVYFNGAVAARLRRSATAGTTAGTTPDATAGTTPDATAGTTAQTTAQVTESSAAPPAPPPPHVLGLMIATGLGLHNFSEGLAIGQSAATGAIAFAGVLIVGFALHNITEGFGIAAPMSASSSPVSWGFLVITGLVAGGPTFLGTIVGYVFHSDAIYVLFLALAAGALIYVLNELFLVGRRLGSARVMAWGVLIGLIAAYATDLLLVAFGG